MLFQRQSSKSRQKRQTAEHRDIQKPNSVSMVVKSSDILSTSISRTTISPASVVIIACSSRPERESTRLSTATIIPMAAILKINSTSAVITPLFNNEQ